MTDTDNKMNASIKHRRVVFVTGASRGIGRSIAEYFLAKGYFTALGYFENQQGAEELTARFDNSLCVRVDVTSRDSIRAAIACTEQRFSAPICILINNAAMAQEKPFLSITDDDFDRMMHTNLRGPFIFSQEVIPGMQSLGWGRIVNVSSIGGQWGGFNQVHYAASKAALINLTRSTAKIYSKNGITCNAVSPGLVATDMSAAELSTPAGIEKVKNIPTGRLGEAVEIAAATYFLCSDDAAYITGQTLNLNGGMYFD